MRCLTVCARVCECVCCGKFIQFSDSVSVHVQLHSCTCCMQQGGEQAGGECCYCCPQHSSIDLPGLWCFFWVTLIKMWHSLWQQKKTKGNSKREGTGNYFLKSFSCSAPLSLTPLCLSRSLSFSLSIPFFPSIFSTLFIPLSFCTQQKQKTLHFKVKMH